MPLLHAAVLVMALGLAADGDAARQIALRVDPPQPVTAITLRNGEALLSIGVRDGQFDVPAELPLPWTVGLTRFEATNYTREDLDAGRPLLLRELATLSGIIQARPSPSQRFTWLSVRAADGAAPEEREIARANDGAFRARVPAGRYHGAVFGGDCATRIRSGVVLAPGVTTDLGMLICEPTVAVAVRVLDGGSENAVANARVIWDPPTALNANVARVLYADRWSGRTDRRGALTVRGVGPVPVPVRWRVEAEGFATAQTAGTQIAEAKSVSVPDVKLQPTPLVVVQVRLPKDPEDLAGATLYVGEPKEPRTRRFRAVGRAPFREGDVRFTLRSHGPKRLWVESAEGRRLLDHDLEVDRAVTEVRLEPRRAEIHGTVTQSDETVAGATVRVADPTDGAAVLARVRTDDDGHYRLSTWQSGSAFLYAIGAGGPGLVSGSKSARLEIVSGDDHRVDFDLDAYGVTVEVVDAESGSPVEARVQTEVVSGHQRGGGEQQTDANGRLVLSGFRDGIAKLHVSADGYAAESLELPLREGAPAHVVRLRRASPVTGRVIDARGVPIAGARVLAGFSSDFEMNPRHLAETDPAGRFRFDSPPEEGTPVYVIGAGHALTIAMLNHDGENTLVLHPPGTGVVTLLQDHAPPPKLHLVLAAPTGGGRIPLGVLDELAELNGMTAFQLHGSSTDGTLVLPEFLGPGSWELFIVLRGAPAPSYHHVGTIRTPLPRSIALSFASP
ncbi:MAG: carboxypeptidase-like regulatory domain-containing protein [Thermoanaerobaculia bacterium]